MGKGKQLREGPNQGGKATKNGKESDLGCPNDTVLQFLKALWGGQVDKEHLLGRENHSRFYTEYQNLLSAWPLFSGSTPRLGPGPVPHHEIDVAVLIPEILHQLLKAVQLLAHLNNGTSQ